MNLINTLKKHYDGKGVRDAHAGNKFWFCMLLLIPSCPSALIEIVRLTSYYYPNLYKPFSCLGDFPILG